MNKKRKRRSYLRDRYQGNDKVLIRDENKDGYIMLKQESLYRPLLIVFGIQLLVMMIVFPNIFDSLWPNVMNQIRNIISWMALSAAGTLLPIPGLSPSDYRYIGVILSPTQTDLYVLLIGLLIVASDTLFAFFGYKFTKTLRTLFMVKKNQKNEEKVNTQFKKYGNVAMFLGAATPLPFTLMIYTAGALKLPLKGFFIAVVFGRALKYVLIALPIRLFHFDLIGYGRRKLDQFLAGDLKVDHYIFIVISLLLIGWLLISIFRTIKKNKIQKKVT